MPDDRALHDSYAGVDVALPGLGMVTVPALRFADGARFLALSARVQQGDRSAAYAIVRDLPGVVGLGGCEIAPEDVLRLFSRLWDPGQYIGAPEEPEEPEEVKSDLAYTWTDMLADYAATYGGPPRASDPWPLVLALIARTARFEARAKLRLLDSVGDAIASALASGPEVMLHRDALYRSAYPVTRTGPPMALIQNTQKEPA